MTAVYDVTFILCGKEWEAILGLSACEYGHATMKRVSSNLYNAYRINRPVSELPMFMAEMRKAQEETFSRLYNRALALLSAAIIDHGGVEGEWATEEGLEDVRGVLLAANALVVRRNKEILDSGRRNVDWDLGFEVCFIFDPENSDRFYALIWTEAEWYIDSWKSIRGVESWIYYDSTDRPEDISSKEWSARKGLWDRLVGWAPFRQVGLIWRTGSHLDMGIRVFDEELFWQSMPTVEVRKQKLVKEEADRRAGLLVLAEWEKEGRKPSDSVWEYVQEFSERARGMLADVETDVAEPVEITRESLGAWRWE